MDFDTNYKQKRMDVKRIGWIFRFLRLKTTDIFVYRTKHGIHVKIWVEQKLQPLMTIMIQALCNSDYARECFNLVRAVNMLDKNKKFNKTIKECWNVLFYKKIVNNKVVSKEKFDSRLTNKLRGELWKQ